MFDRTVAPAAIVCAFVAATPVQAASVAEWRRDIDEIVRQVRLVHPDPYTRVGELTFLRAAEDLKERLPQLSEEQRVVEAMKLMALIEDGHSLVEPTTERFAAWYPFRLVQFSDGYFLSAVHESFADMAGAQVLSIAGRPVAEVAEAARDLLPADNRYWRKENLYAVHNSGLMKGLGYAVGEDDSLVLQVRLTSGRVVERRISHRRPPVAFNPSQASFDWRFSRTEILGPPVVRGAEYVTAFQGLRGDAFGRLDAARPVHLSLRSLNTLPLPQQDAYYVMINIWHGTAQESIPAMFARAMREVDAQKPRRLILDLRWAIGGDGSNGWPVIRELMARRLNPSWQELYILVSGRTYSASLNALGPLLLNVPATVVGEPMGGSWQVFGDYSTFDLPRTGLTLRVSALRHQMSESTDLRTELPVDYPAVFSFADWAAGRDPAIDPILAGEEVRSILMIARADGGAAARAAYLNRRERFSGRDGWGPPTEPELRAVGADLTLAGRIPEAIETYRLSAEIHPTEWRSWFNLGNALRAAGQNEAALDAYRRTLALNDPTNFNQAFLTTRVADMERELGQTRPTQ